MSDGTMPEITNPVGFILGEDPSVYQVDYIPQSSIASFHDLPRFSHSNDFSLLFSSDPDDVRDYSLGLLFLAVFIISFFVVWGFILLLFKCIGPKHLGILSGFPFQKDGCKANLGRSTLLFSSFSIILLAILLVAKGLTELQTTSDTIDMTNQDVIKIHDEFSSLAQYLKDVSRAATPVRDELVNILQQDICPLQPGSMAEATVRSVGYETLGGLQQLDDFIASELEDVQFALDQVENATTQVNVAVSKVQFTGAQVTAIMFPYFVIPAFIIVGVVMAWYDIFSEGYYFFLTWIILPVMILMTMFAFVASGWVVMSVEGNSDFCYPTPEYNVPKIMEQYGLQPGQLYYDVVMFYAQQCLDNNNPWAFLEEYHGQLTNAKSNIDVFLKLVAGQTPEQLSQECGIEFSPVLELLNSLLVQTTILLNTSTRAMHLMTCSNIVPLYTNAVYEGMCQNNLVGAHWCFACLLLMSFFGMLCIMFRGAYYPIDYFYFTDEDDDEKSLYSTSESDEVEDEEGEEIENEEEVGEDLRFEEVSADYPLQDSMVTSSMGNADRYGAEGL
mmetsp:Transcript_4514/g.8330  ORF Transcript_4514/g.8330 Transcript_4514/m.8330 type:complete len:558 (-) Transcript_4514:63-1736(-)